MGTIRDRLAEALVQAAIEGDDSPKVTVSMRVLELIAAGSGHPAPDLTPFSLTPEELTAALERPGRSQSDLARHMDLDPSAVNRICRGSRQIKADEALAIHGYLAGSGSDTGTLAQRIASRLDAIGENQFSITKKAGLHEDYVRNILEKGVRNPSAGRLKQLAEALGCDPQWLIEGIGVGERAETPGERLRRRRRELKMRVGDLGKIVGLSASAVRNQENGTNGIPFDKAEKYSEALMVPPAWLMFGESADDAK